MSSWPKGSNLTEVRGGGTNLHPQDKLTQNSDNLFSMQGPKVFKFSLPKVHKMIRNMLKRNNINQLDTQLAQTKNSYMKVLGAEELIKIQLDEHAAKEKVEEDSGD